MAMTEQNSSLVDTPSELELGSHDILIERVKAGDAEAQYQLASELMPNLTEVVWDGELDLRELSESEAWELYEAVKLYCLASKQGCENAQIELTGFFNKSFSYILDEGRTIGLFRLAAEAGNSSAQYQLASALEPPFYDPEPKPETLDECIKWYRLAAEHGSKTAQLTLGMIYTNTRWPERWPQQYCDKREAIKWYEMVAESGNVLAMKELGELYYQFAEKMNSHEDYTKARHWSRLALEEFFGREEKEQDLIGEYDRLVVLGRNMTRMLDRGLGGEIDKMGAEQTRRKYLELASRVTELMKSPYSDDEEY
jgi:TPR repeat protein